MPNFLIQEHFDAFNEPWTRELVTWRPTVDPANGHLSLPDAPGLGIDLDLEVDRAPIPTIPKAYLNVHAEGWEKRLGSRGEPGVNLGAMLPTACFRSSAKTIATTTSRLRIGRQ